MLQLEDMLPNIDINYFDYCLPQDRIAKYPLENRSSSKLLLANARTNTIEHYIFNEVIDLLPNNTSLYINKTKVISGRFYMKKETGGRAELLLIEPILPSSDPQIALKAEKETTWKAIIGGKKIRVGSLLNEIDNKLKAEVLEKEGNQVIVKITWDSGTFSELLLNSGVLPLPPYLNRQSEEKDKETYQTVFAKHDGSIAAPTAGLHFTPEILQKLQQKGIKIRELTLHVGPGTFLPVSSDDIQKHNMHSEMFTVSKTLLTDLILDLDEKRKIVCVGTTSIRTLESLFWAGNDIENFKDSQTVSQWSPYQKGKEMTPKSAIDSLLKSFQSEQIKGKTELIIVPDYQFKFTDGLFTNFHIPKSTLLLLVSAFVGEQWKEIYQSAMDNEYRFLSYGDSSLLWRK